MKAVARDEYMENDSRAEKDDRGVRELEYAWLKCTDGSK